jgi:hypothetical protein
VTLLAEAARQQARELRFVLDDQDTHALNCSWRK